jgi:hypothetical protein
MRRLRLAARQWPTHICESERFDAVGVSLRPNPSVLQLLHIGPQELSRAQTSDGDEAPLLPHPILVRGAIEEGLSLSLGHS